ncbi:MAG TPA: hypothetical protein VMW10_07260, partial [Alphaproteobacteria bacterium]|nr:hypothetical protein [Alphaproteobacteria bacterium]
MSNKVFSFVSFSFLLFINMAEAMENLETPKERNHITTKIACTGDFKDVPDDFIVNIPTTLFGKDFLHLALLSKRFADLLMNHEPFFMPAESEVVCRIAATPIEKVSDLKRDWGSTKNVMHTLHKILHSFEGYPTDGVEDLKESRKKFKNYVKTLNILYELG